MRNHTESFSTKDVFINLRSFDGMHRVPAKGVSLNRGMGVATRHIQEL